MTLVALIPGNVPGHTGARIDTHDGPRFWCARCRRLLDAFAWATACAGDDAIARAEQTGYDEA